MNYRIESNTSYYDNLLESCNYALMPDFKVEHFLGHEKLQKIQEQTTRNPDAKGWIVRHYEYQILSDGQPKGWVHYIRLQPM